jgi:hypothetical protein
VKPPSRPADAFSPDAMPPARQASRAAGVTRGMRHARHASRTFFRQHRKQAKAFTETKTLPDYSDKAAFTARQKAGSPT